MRRRPVVGVSCIALDRRAGERVAGVCGTITNERTGDVNDSDSEEEKPFRLYLGEAWMMCKECGAKLYSFDGDVDGSRMCPYKSRDGKCEPR